MRVLVVEDDDLIASGILAGLLAHGIQAQCAGNVAEAEAAFFENTFDALVLDLGLPDQDGMSFLQMLRRCGEQLPVIIVTARDGVEHRLAGLHGGADDYLIKPFDLRELAARLHVVVRRAQGRAVQRISAGPLEIEPQTRQVWLEGEGIELSRREVDLLVHLFDAGGRWIPAAVLQERVYGIDVEIGSNALNVHIHNIRRKLGAEAIETLRGMGYRLGWGIKK